MMMSDELKPCAHCGGEAKLMLVDDEYNPYYWIECALCHVQTDAYCEKDDAIAAWNTRADDAHECDYIGGKCSKCGKDLPEPGYTGYEYEGNYCPTCGAKVRKVEPPEQPVDNAQADTREQLEADIRKRTECSWVTAPHEKVIEWLDRQAAITKRKRQLEYDAVAYDRDYFRKHVGQMNEFIDKLVAERDELQKVVHIQAESFKKLELELKEAKDAIRGSHADDKPGDEKAKG